MMCLRELPVSVSLRSRHCKADLPLVRLRLLEAGRATHGSYSEFWIKIDYTGCGQLDVCLSIDT